MLIPWFATKGCQNGCQNDKAERNDPLGFSVFGLVKPCSWWRRRDSNLRPRAYESLLAWPPSFALIRFCPSKCRKTEGADNRDWGRTKANSGSVDAQWMLARHPPCS